MKRINRKEFDRIISEVNVVFEQHGEAGIDLQYLRETVFSILQDEGQRPLEVLMDDLMIDHHEPSEDDR